MSQPLIIAIDGPAGAGKGTVSRLVAAALGIPCVDTGSTYRAVGLAAIRAGLALDDAAALAALARRVRIELIPDGPLLLDGEDIRGSIRTLEVSAASAAAAKVPAVREVLVPLQREAALRAGGVLEGRDIGTKVFPETPYKYFLEVRPEVSAKRRYEEMLAQGQPAVYEEVLAQMVARDRQDRTRADSPLRCDDTYHLIDTSDLTIDEVVERILAHVRSAPA